MRLWQPHAAVAISLCFSILPTHGARLSSKRRSGLHGRHHRAGVSSMPRGHEGAAATPHVAEGIPERLGFVPGQSCATNGNFSSLGCALGCSCKFGQLCRQKLWLSSSGDQELVDVGVCEISSKLALGGFAVTFALIAIFIWLIGYMMISLTLTKEERRRGWLSSDSLTPREVQRCSMKALPTLVQIGGRRVPVTVESGIDATKIVETRPFKQWTDAIAAEQRLFISKIHVQSVDMVGSKVGCVKFEAAALVDGNTVPAIVFMRGITVAILIVLHVGDQSFTLVVRQPRVPVCSGCMVEIPSGTIDRDGRFTGAAAKELKREAGIDIRRRDLVDMTYLAYSDKHAGIFPSCGSSYEVSRLFLYQQSVSIELLEKLQENLTGIARGDEIKLQIMPLGSLWRSSPDANSLSALSLHQKLQGAGRFSDVSAWSLSE